MGRRNIATVVNRANHRCKIKQNCKSRNINYRTRTLRESYIQSVPRSDISRNNKNNWILVIFFYFFSIRPTRIKATTNILTYSYIHIIFDKLEGAGSLFFRKRWRFRLFIFVDITKIFFFSFIEKKKNVFDTLWRRNEMISTHYYGEKIGTEYL